MSYRCSYVEPDGYGIACGEPAVVGSGQGLTRERRLSATKACARHAFVVDEDASRWNPRAYAEDFEVKVPDPETERDAAQVGGVYYVGASKNGRVLSHTVCGPFGTKAAALEASAILRRVVKDPFLAFGWSFVSSEPDYARGHYSKELVAELRAILT